MISPIISPIIYALLSLSMLLMTAILVKRNVAIAVVTLIFSISFFIMALIGGVNGAYKAV